MKIGIIGAGNSGCALAADYAAAGHEVTLIKSSHSVHEDNFIYLEKNGGKMVLDEFGTEKTGYISKLSRRLEDAKDCRVVLLCTQTAYHRPILEKLVPLLGEGQILLIDPGYLSTAYVIGMKSDPGLIVAEAESNFIDGRISVPGRFKVGFRNVRNPLGIYPRRSLPKAREVLDSLGTPFTYLESVVEAALHNPNMIVHTVGAVMSIPRIEATGGDYCMYHEVFTPSVWNILEKLDGEKMSVLQKLGCEPLPYVEACKFRNSLEEKRPGKEVFFEYASMPTRAKGPVSVDSRYISEDVPQGLMLLESMGKALNVATPVACALIELASAALGRDLRSQGRTLEALGYENVKTILEDAGGDGETCPD